MEKQYVGNKRKCSRVVANVNKNKNDFKSKSKKFKRNYGSNEKSFKCLQNLPIVTLTKPRYFILPSLCELPKYVNKNGQCLVKGLTIGHTKYGCVHFLDKINITNLNFDKLIHFQHGKLTVCPFDGKGTITNQKVRRRANVTFYKIWPRNKSGHKIKNIECLSKICFTQKLKKICRKYGFIFKNYLPESGLWTFTVNHFSKIGISDSDEEYMNTESKKLDLNEIAKSYENVPNGINNTNNTDVSSEETDGLNKQHNFEDTENVETNEQNDNTPAIKSSSVITFSLQEPLPIKMLNKTTETNVSLMKVTFFENEIVPKLYNEGLEESFVQFNEIEKSSVTDMDGNKYIYDDIYVRSDIPYSADKTLNMASLVATEFARFQRYKVGWTVGLKFVGIKRSNCFSYNGIILSRDLLLCEVDALKKSDNDPVTCFLLGCLDLIKKESNKFLDLRNKYNILMESMNLLEQILIRYPGNKTIRQFSSIWKLCDIFWGPLGKLQTDSNHRRLFSKWLENITENSYIQKNTISDKVPDVFETIFLLLCSHNIKDAAESANNCNLPYLSLFISQMSSDDKMKSIIQKQITEWENDLSCRHMDKEMLKIYYLLSGNVSTINVNIFESLDWTRALALYLWYISPATAPISCVIKSYEEAFAKFLCARPIPFYASENRIKKDVFDIVFHITKLYSNKNYSLANVFNTSTHTENTNDFRLIWILMQIFVSLEITCCSEKLESYVHVKFATQLEQAGYWKWAVFVLSFIKEETLKKDLIIHLITRNLMPCDVDELIHEFRVSSEWIYEAEINKRTF